jgi:DNA repair photolyase
MANSSDPYTPEEKKLRITRDCLHLFHEYDIKILIITKSSIITRDIDIICKMKASVSITITTLSDTKAHILEPQASAPSERVKTLEILHDNGIPCSVRLDPIIPTINDDELEKIVERVSPYVKHVTSSTIKPRYDSLKRMHHLLDFNQYNLTRIGSSFYLPKDFRSSLLTRVENICNNLGMSFSTCRENYPYNAPSCDGSHLISS